MVNTIHKQDEDICNRVDSEKKNMNLKKIQENDDKHDMHRTSIQKPLSIHATPVLWENKPV